MRTVKTKRIFMLSLLLVSVSAMLTGCGVKSETSSSKTIQYKDDIVRFEYEEDDPCFVRRVIMADDDTKEHPFISSLAYNFYSNESENRSSYDSVRLNFYRNTEEYRQFVDDTDYQAESDVQNNKFTHQVVGESEYKNDYPNEQRTETIRVVGSNDDWICTVSLCYTEDESDSYRRKKLFYDSVSLEEGWEKTINDFSYEKYSDETVLWNVMLDKQTENYVRQAITELNRYLDFEITEEERAKTIGNIAERMKESMETEEFFYSERILNVINNIELVYGVLEDRVIHKEDNEVRDDIAKLETFLSKSSEPRQTE